MTISRMSTAARCTVSAAVAARWSPGGRVQHVAGESSFDVAGRSVDLAEPVSGAWRDDDDVSRPDLVRLAALDSSRPIFRIGHRPAGRVPAAALENVVDLRHFLTIAFPGVDAGVVQPIHPAPNDERVHDARRLTSDDAERRLVVVEHLLPLRR